ncbi:MAG: phospholipid transport system substrate-binding protein, partial [Candidatus Azotimanducaceae bacterium]
MSRTIRDGILPSAVLIMIGFLLMAGQAMGEQKGARIAVEESTNQLLSKLVEIQPLYTENPEQFFQQVGSSLAPFIDFKGFSRGVMAKYYRRATDDQKSRFVSVFQDKMIRTYAKALVEFDNQRVEVVESTSTESKPDRAAIDLLV